MLRVSLVVVLAPLVVQAFYLPGAAPKSYSQGDNVELFVNALTPTLMGTESSRLRSMLNYDYYNPNLHFCQPEQVQRQPESLGSILFGDRLYNSPFDLKMLEKNGTCQTLCTQSDVPGAFINERIREDYDINWLVDGLPAAEMKIDLRTDELFFDMGFNLGNVTAEQQPFLHNHYEIVMKYHQPTQGVYRVVGFLVWPQSVGGDQKGESNCGPSPTPLILSESTTNDIRWTYRVTWEESDTPWSTRFDNYLHVFDPRIHWFSLINSIIVVTLLCIMVSMILLRSVARDISRYNAVDLSEDVQDDSGWKLVWGEVFRTPRHPLFLSVAAGNGAQLGVMFAFTLIFALLGFLSPSNRGSLATVMMVVWTFLGSINGYVSSRVYATLGGSDRRKNAFLTATILPTLVFAVVFLLDLTLVSSGSSGAVPFGTLLLIVVMWFGISAPLSTVGSWYGSKHGGVTHPVRVNQIPRQIPPGPKYLQPWAATLLGGLLPFGAAFVELYFVMSSIFANRSYAATGFLFLTAFLVALTAATSTILFTYFILCAEEYRWHWRAFFIGGGSAFWIFAYGVFYWASRLSLDSLSSVVLYFGYLLIFCLLDFLVTGTIGFLASYWAIRRLYSAIRID